MKSIHAITDVNIGFAAPEARFTHGPMQRHVILALPF
jgi:hypothetical protein